MANYRRARVPGATYFFTVTLSDRRAAHLAARASLLRAIFRTVRRQRPFVVDAIVVLPDHIHTIWTLPPDDADYSGRWRAIKARFSRTLARDGVPLARNRRDEYDLWQRRFWEHLIRDEEDFACHLDRQLTLRRACAGRSFGLLKPINPHYASRLAGVA
jgi:putative transposase